MLAALQGFEDDQVNVERFLNLRYDGTDVPVMTPCPEEGGDPAAAFEGQYKREFGFTLAVRLAPGRCRTHSRAPPPPPSIHDDKGNFLSFSFVFFFSFICGFAQHAQRRDHSHQLYPSEEHHAKQ